MTKPGGYLYALRAEGLPYIKIGCTVRSPQKRLKLLQTGQPYRLELCASVHVEADMRPIEKALHRFLREKRQHGEWFALETMDDAQLVALIGDAMQYLDVHSPVNAMDAFPLGRRLRQVRRAKDLTQEQLAAKSGVNAITISRLESSDASKAYARTVRDLAQALGVSADYLLGLTEKETTP